jgi:methylated-DNA-[protein]-cysteine S-methyltransferase
MQQTAYCLFETTLGWCGIAWSNDGHFQISPAVTLVQLPEATREVTEARIARHAGAEVPSAAPPAIAEVIGRVCLHLRGETQGFRDVPVDLERASDFERRVYHAARQIPAGDTTTYGDLARTLGRPTGARAVGQALGRNPVPIIIPCHRVLAAGGKSGGFSAHGGRETKARMLAIEGMGCGY